jgi:hypothetical protein
MDNIIEQYYEQYNYPSVDKLYKYLKADGHKTTKKYIDEYLSKKMKSNNLKIFKKVKKRWDIFYLIHQMKNGS